MKHFNNAIYIIILILFIIPLKGTSQNDNTVDSTAHELMSAAREIMAVAGNCALITLDDKDLPMVRVMDPFPPESDFTVWFGTNSRSRKVHQIRNNPIVTLYYLDSNATGYVVIHGIANLVNDPMEKDKRWKPQWEAFYPNEREDYLLIKVSPEWMEVLSTTRGILGDPTTWQTPTVILDSNK